MWSVIFFPGMIVHELAHALACVLLGVKVTRVKWWGTKSASVTHKSTTGWKNFVVSIAPFFVNTAFALFTYWVGHKGVLVMPLLEPAFIGKILIFYWLGTSFAYFAFPSETDLRSGWITLWKHYKHRLFFKHGLISFFLHLITLPLLIPAWLVLSLLGFMNQPKAGFAWAITLFLVMAFVVGI